MRIVVISKPRFSRYLSVSRSQLIDQSLMQLSSEAFALLSKEIYARLLKPCASNPEESGKKPEGFKSRTLEAQNLHRQDRSIFIIPERRMQTFVYD